MKDPLSSPILGTMADSNKELGERIRHLREDILGIKAQKDFGAPLEVSRGAVGNWELGKGIKTDNLRRMAEHYGASFDWLATGKGEPPKRPASTNELLPAKGRFRRVRIRGLVQAGYWAEPDERRIPELEYVEAPFSDAYDGLQLEGIRVQGDSMNLVYPEGTVLICASLYDLHEDEPIAGKRYIVRRTRGDGAVEMTVKEVMADTYGKWWLWPKSNNPKHQEPIPFDAQDGDVVEVTARVLFSMRPE